MEGNASSLPSHQWYSGGHTYQVVPFFFKGAGAADIQARATNVDPVRGSYIDNTDVANLVKETWWTGTSNDDDKDRKSTRLNSSHVSISYAVFCLKKKKQMKYQ